MHHGVHLSNPVEGESSMPVDHRITGERARGLHYEHGIVEPRRRQSSRRHISGAATRARREAMTAARARRRRAATRKVADARMGRDPHSNHRLEPRPHAERGAGLTRAERIHDGLPSHPGPLGRALERLGESDRVVSALAQKLAQPASSEHDGGPCYSRRLRQHTRRLAPHRGARQRTMPAQPALSEHGGGPTAAALGSTRATPRTTPWRAAARQPTSQRSPRRASTAAASQPPPSVAIALPRTR